MKQKIFSDKNILESGIWFIFDIIFRFQDFPGCQGVHLFGLNNDNHVNSTSGTGITWNDPFGPENSLRMVRVLIRPLEGFTVAQESLTCAGEVHHVANNCIITEQIVYVKCAYLCLSVCLSVGQSDLSVCLSVCLTDCMSVCLSVCLSV